MVVGERIKIVHYVVYLNLIAVERLIAGTRP